MRPGVVLTLVATLLGGSDPPRIDRGLLDGLRLGDRGEVYYELEVAGAKRRIEVGEGRIVELGDSWAAIDVEASRPIPQGGLVEFRIAGERLDPADTLAAARATLGETAARDVARQLLRGLVADADPAVTEELRSLLGVEKPAEEPAAAAPPPTRVAPPPTQAAPPPPPAPPTLRVSGGFYTIGRNPEDADFYNEQPAFDIEVGDFRMDLEPSSAGTGNGLTFAAAVAECRSRGARLPSEFEWEIAAKQPGFVRGTPPYEWTASWYQPYPGNSRREKRYGRTHRVVRGGSEDPHRRHFMDPATSSPTVGFRCVRSGR